METDIKQWNIMVCHWQQTAADAGSGLLEPTLFQSHLCHGACLCLVIAHSGSRRSSGRAARQGFPAYEKQLSLPPSLGLGGILKISIYSMLFHTIYKKLPYL